ncbi:MAG: hypothetical protein II912_05730 [Clostridia bacterium]|nr:hypothetical protein [Clostridia bacterium]
MGRIVSIILLIGVLLASMGGGQPDNTAEDTVIDYGESGIFSLEDRHEAVSLILARTGSWRSLEHLHTVRYGGDAASLEEKGFHGFNEVMVFFSDFKTVRNSPAAEGFNADSEYTNWGWYLGRTEDGSWKLIDMGY